MTHTCKILAAGLLLLLPLSIEAEDISTVSVEKDGKVVETLALAAPTAGEGWLPKKVKRQCSLQEEHPDIREALVSYFSDSTMDRSDMTYTACLTDLDRDGKEEALVLLSSPYTDKEGSPMLLVLSPSEEGWTVGQEIMGFPGTFFLPERGKKGPKGLLPIYFAADDGTGQTIVKKLVPVDGLYPPVANGDIVDTGDKTFKKMKGTAYFCGENKKKETVKWFSLGEGK